MKRHVRQSIVGATALLAAVSSTLPTAAVAQDPAQFYAGRTITFVVGYGAGASYDSGARLIARHLGKHVPGKPNVVVQNMPGAGSMTSANHLYNAAAKDGTALAMFGRGLYLEALFGNPLVKFDPAKFNWIGSYGSEVSALVSGINTPFKTVADVQKAEMIIGASGPGADTHAFGLVLQSLANGRIKIISGFPGQAEAFLAIDRGEVHGNAGATIGTLMALRPDWLKEKGKANFIVQLATEKHPKYFQGVPLIMEFAKNDVDRRALELIFARQKFAYAFAAPPGVPADRVKALRDAFNAAVTDKEFLVDAAKMNADISPVGGEAIAVAIQQGYDMPKAVLERAKAALTAVKE